MTDHAKITRLIAEFASRVMAATKASGGSSQKNKSERAAARRLLTEILGRKPTDEEIDSIIPG